MTPFHIKQVFINTLVGLLFCVQISFAAHPRLPEKHLPVPIIPQATDYSCGAATMLAVLLYWQVYDGTESSLYPMLKTDPQKGTDSDDMAVVAKDFGLKAENKEGMTIEDLQTSLRRGETIILDIQAWRDSDQAKKSWRETWENGHYIILVGIDNGYAYFMDPSTAAGYGYIPLLELLERWHDYADNTGTVVKYFNLGLVISGKNPLKTVPGPLVRIE